MSNYRNSWRKGKDGLIELIEGLQSMQTSELVPKRTGIELVTKRKCNIKHLISAVDRLFDVQDYGLRIRGTLGQSDFYIELTNEGGKVRYNLYKWPKAAV